MDNKPTNTEVIQNFNISSVDGHIELVFEGEIDAFMISQLKGRIDRYMEQNWREGEGCGIIIDLCQVSFIDSHAVGLFVSLLKRVHNVGTKLVFIGAEGQPASILKIVGFNDEIVCYAKDIKEAMSLLK